VSFIPSVFSLRLFHQADRSNSCLFDFRYWKFVLYKGRCYSLIFKGCVSAPNHTMLNTLEGTKLTFQNNGLARF
jgi:hypothetical protein